MTPQQQAQKRAAERGTEAERRFSVEAQAPGRTAAPTPRQEDDTVSAQIVPAPSAAVMPIPEDALALLEPMLAQVPEVGGDAWTSIIGQLSEAQDERGLNAPWNTNGLADLKGRPLKVLAVKQAPSDFQSGFGVYLVVDVVAMDTGEKMTVTTGAGAPLAQLVRAHALGMIPCLIIPRVADRPTKAGFYPQHLEFARIPPAQAAAAQPQG